MELMLMGCLFAGEITGIGQTMAVKAYDLKITIGICLEVLNSLGYFLLTNLLFCVFV